MTGNSFYNIKQIKNVLAVSDSDKELLPIPNDPLSRLRYFMDCMVTVVPNLNQNGQLDDIIDYGTPMYFSGEAVGSLIKLWKVCFAAFNGKCIFLAPQLCINYGNEFYNIKQMDSVLAVSNSVIIGGQVQSVQKILTYEEEWAERYFINPIKQL